MQLKKDNAELIPESVYVRDSQTGVDDMRDLIEYIQLPEDWLQEVANRVGDDTEIANLRPQRDRLEAERRRLQQMRIEGDFDDNMDYYHEEMNRIRRETASLPTYDQIETLRATATTITSLAQIWVPPFSVGGN